MIIIPLADILIAGQHAPANTPIEVAEAVGRALVAAKRATTGEFPQSMAEISDDGVLSGAETAVIGKKRRK